MDDLQKLAQKCRCLESELLLERADKNMRLGRLAHEIDALTKKVERLSLKLLAEWSTHTEKGDNAT